MLYLLLPWGAAEQQKAAFFFRVLEIVIEYWIATASKAYQARGKVEQRLMVCAQVERLELRMRAPLVQFVGQIGQTDSVQDQ